MFVSHSKGSKMASSKPVPCSDAPASRARSGIALVCDTENWAVVMERDFKTKHSPWQGCSSTEHSTPRVPSPRSRDRSKVLRPCGTCYCTEPYVRLTGARNFKSCELPPTGCRLARLMAVLSLSYPLSHLLPRTRPGLDPCARRPAICHGQLATAENLI